MCSSQGGEQGGQGDRGLGEGTVGVLYRSIVPSVLPVLTMGEPQDGGLVWEGVRTYHET